MRRRLRQTVRTALECRFDAVRSFFDQLGRIPSEIIGHPTGGLEHDHDDL